MKLSSFTDSFSFLTRRFALSDDRACNPRFFVPKYAGRTAHNIHEAIRRTVAAADGVLPSGGIFSLARPILSDR